MPGAALALAGMLGLRRYPGERTLTSLRRCARGSRPCTDASAPAIKRRETAIPRGALLLVFALAVRPPPLGARLRARLPDGTYTATYRVISADTHMVDTLFPAGFTAVDTQEVTGWSARVIEARLSTPRTEDGETIDSGVSQIVWT